MTNLAWTVPYVCLFCAIADSRTVGTREEVARGCGESQKETGRWPQGKVLNSHARVTTVYSFLPTVECRATVKSCRGFRRDYEMKKSFSGIWTWVWIEADMLNLKCVTKCWLDKTLLLLFVLSNQHFVTRKIQLCPLYYLELRMTEELSKHLFKFKKCRSFS